MKYEWYIMPIDTALSDISKYIYYAHKSHL